MAEQVSSESRICIQDPTGKIKTVIFEEDYESAGYKVGRSSKTIGRKTASLKSR